MLYLILSKVLNLVFIKHTVKLLPFSSKVLNLVFIKHTVKIHPFLSKVLNLVFIKRTVKIFPFLFIFSYTTSFGEDPFEKIFVKEMPHQMKYFMASSPNAKLTTIEFKVKTGWQAEKKNEYGVAHLVEHLLFRDNDFENDRSYLQVFKEKGGKVNAFVVGRSTVYKVTIDSKYSLWALKTMTQMLQNRVFNDTDLKKAKQSITIEIGEPSPFERFFKVNIWDLIDKLSLKHKKANFFKNEFGVDLSQFNYSKTLPKLNGEKLSLFQAQTFYEDFYIPKNIKLFIAGNFNKKQFISFIETSWKNYKTKGKEKSLPNRPEPQFVDRPFYSVKPSLYPSMRLGIKVAHLQFKEFVVLNSYFNFTANEIMKSVRNKKGETYTAYFGTSFYKNNGEVYVNMDSTPKAFGRNFKKIKQILLEKIQKEDFSENDFKKAQELLKHSFRSSYEENAKNLLSNLYLVDFYQKRYHFTGSPIKLIEEISLEEYNQILKKLIQKKRYVIKKYPKYIFFHYESFFLNFLSLLLGLFVLKRVIKKPFNHFSVRFVKNINPLPFKLYEISLLFLSSIISGWLSLFLENYFFYNNKLLQSNLITADYLNSMVTTFFFICIFMFFLNFSPKKIYLTDHFLYIKSISYRIKKIPLSEIEKFESISYWRVLFSLQKLWKIKHRFYIYRHFIFWKKVLLISLKGDKEILLDCGVTDSILEKLNQKVPKRR